MVKFQTIHFILSNHKVVNTHARTSRRNRTEEGSICCEKSRFVGVSQETQNLRIGNSLTEQKKVISVVKNLVL